MAGRSTPESFSLAWLREQYPGIEWTEPVGMVTAKGDGYACRVCIANYGQRGNVFQDRAEAEAHIAQEHVRGA